MKILGIERDKTACSYYRILQPLCKLDEHGLAEVHIIKESELADEKAANLALLSDVIVFQRPATEAWYQYIKTCRKYGKIIVSDYDDDPFNTSPLNPYYQYVGINEIEWAWEDGTREMLWQDGVNGFNIERNINHRDMFRLNFKKSDLVSCTTEELRSEFLKINQNVAVLPNVIDFAFFPQGVKMEKNEIRIGWQGGSSHYEDLYMIHKPLETILRKYPNVKFVYFGDMRFKGLFKNCPENQIEYHPWVAHNAYPFKLALLNLDIGLCPLVDNQFNRNKSAIKWMEYSAMGFMSIVSGIPPYSPVVKDGETALMVKSQDDSEWLHWLELAINNPKTRAEIARNAYEDVKKNHNADTKAHLWYEAYDKLLKGNPVAA